MIRKKHLISITFFSTCFCLAITAQSNEYTDNKDGTVTDDTLGITWQAKDDNVQRDWSSADKYCRELVYADKNDWKLPGDYALKSILLQSNNYPDINQRLFPNTKADRYWTGTDMPYMDAIAFFVQFGPKDNFKDKEQRFDAMQMKNKYYVRCIRGTRKIISSKKNK